LVIPPPSRERIRRFTVQASRTTGGLFSLHTVIEGDLTGVRLAGPSMNFDEPCPEAFLAGRERAGYDDFNFAPTTAWAVDRFEAFRAPLRSDRPGCETHITAG
jgi:hypothetical protein